ncbi:Purine nucleoside phosphorylase 1 [Desulfosarcina cetonica]|uniref:purine-nucleoside phosphorylase n=1 Tax=Desulfosarcina cetonica TaxID=90730 RepID=UPI000A64FCA6|nr:purine-nucleoside phosphorylase [Desulfosarcina cetonica]VTR70040.1 Purine nucleoside phosphorylase 1 [Desulfosarcina cetonica]
MNPLFENVHEAAVFLQTQLHRPPLTGIITGTGLGDAVGPLDDAVTLNYGEIPHFPVSTVAGHSGRLLAGTLAGHPVVVMQGRVHLYEGYAPTQVTFPVRVMQALGVRNLILSNAAGGINLAFSQGDLMVIRDHINLTGENPLVGPNHDAWGPRFPDMTVAYDPALIKRCRRAADRLGIVLKSGVYAGLKGPSLETPAEIRFLKTIGADAVGLSTVMETIAAVHAGMRVLGISTITNINDPDRPQPASVEAIIAAANRVAPQLNRLIERVVGEIHAGEPS